MYTFFFSPSFLSIEDREVYIKVGGGGGGWGVMSCNISYKRREGGGRGTSFSTCEGDERSCEAHLREESK